MLCIVSSVKVKRAYTQLNEDYKVLMTEKRKLASQLTLARANVTKAEEILYNRER